MKRSEFHVHTNMSMMDGISTAREYMLLASESNIKALAITDHGSVQNFFDGYRAAVEFGVKLIYGTKLCISENGKRLGDAMILAMNKDGLKNLYNIISISSTKCSNKIPCIAKKNY